jgi:hypothetical protein
VFHSSQICDHLVLNLHHAGFPKSTENDHLVTIAK